MNKGGFGSHGEVEITRTSTETQVTIPLKFAVYSAALVNLLTAILFVFTFVIWWRVDGLRSWAMVLIDWLFIPWLVILAVPWFWQIYRLITQNYQPKIQNQNWPPPFGQTDVTKVGALTWKNASEVLESVDEQKNERNVS